MENDPTNTDKFETAGFDHSRDWMFPDISLANCLAIGLRVSGAVGTGGGCELLTCPGRGSSRFIDLIRLS